MLTVLGISLLVFILVFLLLASGLLLGRAGITGTCGTATDPCTACSPLRRAVCRKRRMLGGG